MMAVVVAVAALNSPPMVDDSLIGGLSLDLHEAAAWGFKRRGAFRFQYLRVAEEVEVRDLMHAGDGAVRGAALLGQVLAPHIGRGISGQRAGRIAALLRAVVNQAVLADVQITPAGAAAPVARLPTDDRVLEVVDLREIRLLEFLHFQKDMPLLLAQRPQLAVAVVNDADGRGEAQLDRSPAYS